jgi:hypothetical protein
MSITLREQIYGRNLTRVEATIKRVYDMRLITKAAYEALLLRVRTKYQLLVACDNTGSMPKTAYVSHFVGNGEAI